jgi:hypothetical protein
MAAAISMLAESTRGRNPIQLIHKRLPFGDDVARDHISQAERGHDNDVRPGAEMRKKRPGGPRPPYEVRPGCRGISVSALAEAL